ncbi:MAG: transglutaminase-like domain-containing protein [Treponema sp.]|jgi:hypothetical protein|nr:transglutaminase-like domain-containing protein [Treponema sp.]
MKITFSLIHRKRLKVLFLSVAFSSFPAAFTAAYPIYSPTWGFALDLPEGYELTGGDRRDRFSFASPEGAVLDIVVYAPGAGGNSTGYNSVEDMSADVRRRLGSKGDMETFSYRGKKAVLFELSFDAPAAAGRNSGRNALNSGWGLSLELNSDGAQPPLLLALAYGPDEREDLRVFHLSALDSLCPSTADRKIPGPITEYSFPRQKRVPLQLAGMEEQALFYENDGEAARYLVDREFALLKRYTDSRQWREAWIRFYRAIYRDSFDRLTNAAFILERIWNVETASIQASADKPVPQEDMDKANLSLASKALAWVQNFNYERDLMGSDFVNLVSAVTEGRGDCDSRAMLWAIILNHADIPAHIMVSRFYGHAMGLADIKSAGAQFEMAGKKWLVAETTAAVDIGLIGRNVSQTDKWLGIEFVE